jgi:hypothetical protein
MMSKDHNQKTEQELHEERVFLNAYTDLKGHKSDMASTKGDMGAIYKRLKDLGWSKADVEFAFTLEDKDVGKVVAEFERRIRIAKMFGHQIGRQIDLLDKDRTPQDERAYEEGLAAGKLRKSASNPYQPGSEEFQRWQEGMNEGTAWINAETDKAVNGEQAPD